MKATLMVTCIKQNFLREDTKHNYLISLRERDVWGTASENCVIVYLYLYIRR